MSLQKLTNYMAAIMLAATSAFAQGVFEGSGEEGNSDCVGDGCGFVPAEPPSDNFSEAVTDSAQGAPDSVSAPDSLKVATTNIDEEDEDRPTYINESAAEYRARKEGFSKRMQFGVRASAGASKSFGNKSSLWNMGLEAGGGLMARLLLGRSFGVATELDFTYRHYSCEKNIVYGIGSTSKFEATIDEKLFEIPLMFQYIFSEDGLFVGLGANLGLKMQGDSEVKQTTDKDGVKTKDVRANTIPTAGVEVGGLLDFGYSFSRWLAADLRFVQNFTNLIDLNLLDEPATLKKSKLYVLHVTLGVTFLL